MKLSWLHYVLHWKTQAKQNILELYIYIYMYTVLHQLCLLIFYHINSFALPWSFTVLHSELYLSSGLGICSFVFWVNRLFVAKKWANERFAQKCEQYAQSLIFGEWPERFAHAHSSPLSDLSESLIFGERLEQIAHGHSYLVSNLSETLMVA